MLSVYLAYKSLEQPENENQGLFDWMWLKLDNGRLWFRRDYERLVAKHKEISFDERYALHNELQSKGSPSKSLMSLLRARYPNLPLSQFVETLKEIRRNDIAQKLMPYVSHNETWVTYLLSLRLWGTSGLDEKLECERQAEID